MLPSASNVKGPINHLACHALQTDLDLRVVAVGPVDETACNRVCVRGVYLSLSIG